MADDAAFQLGQLNRRDFVLAGAGVATASLATIAPARSLLAQAASDAAAEVKPIVEPGQTILFQGDSITDAGRQRGDGNANSPKALGSGYAWLTAIQLLVDSHAAGYRIFNRGISGNKVYQLAERWQADCLDLKPDVVSVLIGVNDFWHKKNGEYDGTVERYETDFRELLKRTKDALPSVRLVVCEPFLLPCGHVKRDWIPEFAPYRASAKRVADEAGAAFVPFQAMFDLAVLIAPPEQWAGDGVHPSQNGAVLMAHAWMKAVGA